MVDPLLLQGVPTSLGEFMDLYGNVLVSFGITVVSFLITFVIL